MTKIENCQMCVQVAYRGKNPFLMALPVQCLWTSLRTLSTLSILQKIIGNIKGGAATAI